MVRFPVILIGLLAMAGTASAFGYDGGEGTGQRVALPGSGDNCSGNGCVDFGAQAFAHARVDEATGATQVCLLGPGPAPNQPGPGVNAGGSAWSGQQGQGVNAGAGGCFDSTTPNGNPNLWLNGWGNTWTPTGGDWIGSCVRSNGDVRSTGVGMNVDGFPVSVNHC